MPTRRHFLKSTAATLTAGLLPSQLFATHCSPRFHFIRIDSLQSWSIADPVSWALANRRQPILERAAKGLSERTEDDGERVIRLVVRRCGLNLLELRPGMVVVHHWGPQLADLRPFFKQHQLTRPEITVQFRERKREITSTKTGEDLLFGSRIAADFPLDLYRNKFASRFTNEPDDWQAAPGTNSGLAWANTENNRIPWAALKSEWRRSASGVCSNCDTPTWLINFGYLPIGMFSRTSNFARLCPTCRRRFEDNSITNVRAWLDNNLDADIQPPFEIRWGGRKTREATT